jgi:diguanylate cyclase (GGDEF)-like protein
MYKVFEELKLSGHLPSPSGVGLAILGQTTGDELSLEELSLSIQADPALTGRILKLANSVVMGGGEPVATVRAATERLGVTAVRNVALGFTLVSGNRSGVCEAFDYDRYWESSVATAAAASVLCRWTRKGIADEAFTCGLLSRIGQLALASIHPDDYSRVLTECKGRSAHELAAEETSVFEIDHCEVTVAMMAEWGLPEYFMGAVLDHEREPEELETEDEETLQLTAILRAACYLSDAYFIDPSDTDRSDSFWANAAEVLSGLGLSGDDPPRIREETMTEWRKWASVLTAPSHTYGPTASDATKRSSDQTHVEPVEAESTEGNRSVRVLAVDDDPTTLRLLTKQLEKAGYDVITAENGQAALEAALHQTPHVIVTDWMMPGMSGVDLCRALRRFEPGRNMYILLLTGREDAEQIVEGFKAGADDYISKPFNPQVLLARVQAGQRMVSLQQQAERDRRARSDMARDLGLKKRQLQGAVWTDFLTGLPNRRYAMDRLDKEWKTAVRVGKPLSVVMVDIDHFKRVNDEHGHDVGDVVLKDTARTLRAVTRRGDVVCRLGGEEFLVINVNSGLRGALNCAERLRSGVERNQMESGSFKGGVTVSLGVAELQDSMNVDQLIKAADEAVYEAKDTGRNKIRIYGVDEDHSLTG